MHLWLEGISNHGLRLLETSYGSDSLGDGNMKVRAHLIRLVIFALLPVQIFAGLMTLRFHRRQIAEGEKNLVRAATALSMDIDRALQESVQALQLLATSEHLDNNNLNAFHGQALKALSVRPAWDAIVLLDLSGQQLVNTRVRFGTMLPRSNIPEVIDAIVSSGQARVSNLFNGSFGKPSIIAVGVPVMRNGKMKHVLTASALPAFLDRILTEQQPTFDSSTLLIDERKALLAHNGNRRKFVGPTTMTALSDQAHKEAAGYFHSDQINGSLSGVGYHLSSFTRWTVGVALPLAVLEAPMRQSIYYTVAGGLALLILAITGAAIAARQIAAPISALALSAEALGRGHMPPLARSSVTEIATVTHALVGAAHRRRHAQDRLAHAKTELRQLSHRLVAAQEMERHDIARELHDEIGSLLTSLKILIRLKHASAGERAQELVDEMLTRVRSLAQSLRPPMLDDLGLLPTLNWHITEFRARTDIIVELQHDGVQRRFAPATEIAVYRIFQEALTNVARHAHAKVVRAWFENLEGAIHLAIHDNGVGFDTAATFAHSSGSGLSGMRERVAALGGTITIQSKPNWGTRVEVEIPITETEAQPESAPQSQAAYG